ncbi:epoxide hydrolase family protein [Nannocystis radixulma]|uniref:Epoxide hydrolase n=1 Tax=Nannocystis radixulma TaxID=2995305 RepID=A0ABT5BK86_9BACT|nr:epoxide hydrolase family protein [Nannocystis radixulma]MDC0674565.1 epoxide hydrolase [Nannocystis radixulma]
MQTIDVQPFTVAVPEAALTDLRRRLAQTRFTDALADAGPDWGIEPAALRALVAHWQRFDWRAAEAAINAFPAFRAQIGGTGVHFVHVRGRAPRRLPIVLTNGWPSCFTELLRLVPLLTEPVDGVAFDVVIPSLPGYGFSDRPSRSGMNITRIAALWAELMAGLGYPRFFAHGSDMGAGVVERLRADHAERVLGIHMVNVFWGYPRPPAPTPAEAAYLERGPQWQQREGAYAAIHATRPHTISAGLNDSPAGLAAWIGEKFAAWSERPPSLDALCTILTIYWVTETIASSQRLYREAFADAGAMAPPPRRGPPVAVAIFPGDILPAPRAWGERWFELARWTEMPRGGHFPGLEAPDLLAADIRAFAAGLGA